MTSDGLPTEMVLNNGVKTTDIYDDGSVTSEQSQDNPEGEGSEAESLQVPPPPPPLPGVIPEPPPLPGAMLQRRGKAIKLPMANNRMTVKNGAEHHENKQTKISL